MKAAGTRAGSPPFPIPRDGTAQALEFSRPGLLHAHRDSEAATDPKRRPLHVRDPIRRKACLRPSLYPRGRTGVTAPAACHELSSIPRRTTIRKLYSAIAQILDVWADRASRQIQRFSDFRFPSTFSPEPDEQLIALGFGRRFSGQEFR